VTRAGERLRSAMSLEEGGKLVGAKRGDGGRREFKENQSQAEPGKGDAV